MSEMKFQVLAADGRVKAESTGGNRVSLVFEEAYEEGDQIVFTAERTGMFYQIQVDDCLGEGVVYLTESRWVFDIPFGEKRVSYSPRVFMGERHLLTAQPAEQRELEGRRNLALNVLDQHGDRGCFPPASANVETRGESVFAARNAIDGVLENLSHGEWPYESWGINRRDDAEIRLDFGREVEIDEIVLWTRADFPHDNWWVEATFEFSDGTEKTVQMEKSIAPHRFPMEPKKISWMKMRDMKKAEDPSPFPALTQIQVYGREL